MSKTLRSSKRERQKAKRKQVRKKSKKSGRKAGSIAIHSRLPGLEGTEIGAMDIIVDTRRKETHPAEISISVHRRADQRTIAWSLETGFGGVPPRVGYQVLPDSQLDDIPPITWMSELPASSRHDSQVGRECEVSPSNGDTHDR